MYEVFIYKENKLIHSFLTNAIVSDGAYLVGYRYIIKDLVDADNISDYDIKVNEVKFEDMKVEVK